MGGNTGMMPLALGGGQMPMPSAPAVQLPMAPALNAGVLDMQQGGGAGALHQGLKRPPAPSPFAAIAQPLSNAGVALPGLALPGGGDKPAPPKSSPFAVTNVMETLTESFPNFPPGQHPQAGGGERGRQGRCLQGVVVMQQCTRQAASTGMLPVCDLLAAQLGICAHASWAGLCCHGIAMWRSLLWWFSTASCSITDPSGPTLLYMRSSFDRQLARQRRSDPKYAARRQYGGPAIHL